MEKGKRLIDANAMREDWLENGENEYVYDTNAVLDSIDEQPTVDAAPVVHGRWVNPYMNRYGHPCHCCSVCGFKASYQDKYYCPNCGAKMDGGEKNER